MRWNPPHVTGRDMRERLRPVRVELPPHGVFVLESHHAPEFAMADSRHAFLEIFYILRGGGTVRVAGRDHRCGPDDVVVVPTGAVHRITDDAAGAGPLSLYGICVAPEVYRCEPAVARVPPGRLPLNALALPQLRAGLREILYEQALARPGHRAAVVGLTLRTLAVLVRGNLAGGPGSAPAGTDAAGHAAAVRGYLDSLARRFYEPATLDGTAAGLGMSRRRFTQLFRELAGESWLGHLTRLRVAHACRLLKETPRSVVAVAFESGFEDLSSFYRAFKRHTGLPPQEWRQANA